MNVGWSIDDLIQHCVKEIAWDGGQGSDRERIWEFANNYIRSCRSPPATTSVETNQPKQNDETCQLDNKLKDYLWRLLVKHPQITLTTVTALSQGTSKSTSASRKKTVDDSKNVNSTTCTEGEERLVANNAYRRQLIAGGSDMSSMTDTIWRVLEAVGRKRERGITQVELHQELNIGAQPVFHIIKQLSTRGLVKKVNLVFQKNNTNLCLHTIFAPLNDSYRAQLISIRQKEQAERNKRKRKKRPDDDDDDNEDGVEDDDEEDDEMAEQINTFTAALLKGQTQERWQSNLVRQGITDILATVPDCTLSIQELRGRLLAHASTANCIKWFRRTIRFLINKGYLEALELPHPEGNGIEKAARLVMPYVAGPGYAVSSSTPSMQGNKQIIGTGPNARIDTAILDSNDGMAMQYPPDIQIFWRVKESGSRGITVQDIAHQLGHPGNKIIHRHLDNLSDTKLETRQSSGNTSMAINSDKAVRIVRAVEFAGRMRRYRYFIPEAYEQFLKKEGFSPPVKHNTTTKKIAANSAEASTAVLTTPTSELSPSHVDPNNNDSNNNTATPSQVESNDSTMSPKKKPHGHGVQNWKNNITMERRKADLMDVFEEKKIVIDSELPDLYRRQLMASGQPVEHKSDRRTIYRAVRALELEGKVKQITVNIPLLIGNQLMRILYLHSSVDPDSDLVRDTIKHIRHDMSMRSHPSLTPKVMLHNTEAKIVDPTSTGSPTANASDETLEANRNWMHNAFNNGWIRQRMVRIKLLHLHLFTLFEQCGERTIETVTIFREMPLGLFLQVIGFGFKCKEIETFLEERSDARQVKLSDLNVELRSFLFVRSDRLRRQFRRLLCYLTTMKLIKPLQVNGDTATPEQYNAALMPAYQLCEQVPLYNYSHFEATRPLLRNVQLRQMADATRFWDEVQYMVLHMAPTADLAPIPRDEQGRPLMKRRRRHLRTSASDPLAFVVDKRNWQHVERFTPAQRAVLNASTDRLTGWTPLMDDARCATIAAALDISITRVKAYYRYIEERHIVRTRQRTRRYQKRKQRKLNQQYNENSDEDQANNDNDNDNDEAGTTTRESTTSDDVNVRQEPKDLALRRIYRNRQAHLQHLIQAMPHGAVSRTDLPQRAPYRVTRRRQRHNWKPDEDDRLLHAYAIRRTLDTHVLSWIKLATAMPNRDADHCRRRVQILLRRPAQLDRLSALSVSWPQLYLKGLATKELTEDRSRKTANQLEVVDNTLENEEDNNDKEKAEIARFQEKVDYFCRAFAEQQQQQQSELLSSVSPSSPSSALPSTLTTSTLPTTSSSSLSYPIALREVVDNYRLAPMPAIGGNTMNTTHYDSNGVLVDPLYNSGRIGAFMDQITAMSSRLQAYLSVPYTCFWKEQDQSSYSTSNVIIDQTSMMTDSIKKEEFILQCTQILIKMILLTPDDNYNPLGARNLLMHLTSPYIHDDIVGQAVLKSYQNNTIIRGRHGLNGRNIPGRNFLLSERYRMAMEGHFGIDTIMEAKQFRQQLLDMNDSMYMSNLPKDGHVMAYLSMIIPPKLQIHVEPRILDEFHNISNVYCPEKPIETSLFVEQSNEDNSNSNNTLLLFNNDETTMSMEQVTDIHVHRVLSLLDEAGESGMTMPALMTALSSNATTTTTTTTDIITCNLLDSILRQLIRHHQVMLAGIDTIYYVTRAYTASWCLPVLSSTSSDGQQVSETERVPPRQWYDIYGNMDKEIWLACQRTLLDAILYRPGIEENRLLQQFSAAFTLVELRDILNHFINKEMITRRYLIAPSSVGLFSKSTPYEVSDSVVLHPNAMPCYWANTDGYAQLSNDEP